MTEYPDKRINARLTHQAFRAINKAGKKAKQWAKDLRALEKEAVANEVFQWKEFEIDGTKYRKRMGLCKDCNCYKHLTPDHIIRRSRGGSNESGNIDWVCIPCHRKRDQQGDIMNKKGNTKKSKFYACKNCKKDTCFILCDKCGQISL